MDNDLVIAGGQDTNIEDGIYQDIDIRKYHNDSALSKTGLSVFAEFSPLHYQTDRETIKPEKESFKIGHLAHYLILEPDEFERVVRVPPANVLSKGGRKGTKKYHEWVEDILSKIPDALIVSQKQKDAAFKMRDKCFAHPDAEQLLTAGHSEVSGFLTLQSGVRMKCRPDHWPATEILTDLKTARTAHPEKFGRAAYRFHYHWSGYLCCWILSELTGHSIYEYYFVVVENEPPFDTTIYKIDHFAMDLAKTEVNYWLEKYEKCFLANEWPGYPKEILTLDLPHTAYRYNKVLAELRERDEDLSEYHSSEDEEFEF